MAGTLVFTVKDLDVTITEFMAADDNKLLPATRKTLVGRAPIAVVGDNIIFTSRSGKDIIVHENSTESHFIQITELKVRIMQEKICVGSQFFLLIGCP